MSRKTWINTRASTCSLLLRNAPVFKYVRGRFSCLFLARFSRVGRAVRIVGRIVAKLTKHLYLRLTHTHLRRLQLKNNPEIAKQIENEIDNNKWFVL